MTTDYSQFLLIHKDGYIWWRLEDAIKLGAGYLPVRDNKRNLLVLRAPNNRVRANERTLLGDFHKSVQDAAQRQGQRQKRDRDCFVRAREFIEWLSQHIALTQATIPFPNDLACAVGEAEAEKEAVAAQAKNAPAQKKFESLEAALEGWFAKPLAELPEAKRLCTERDEPLLLLVWDKRTEGERRSIAKEWDYRHDPELEPERQRIVHLQDELYAVHRDIRKWELKATSTAGDEAIKEDRLKGLRDKAKKLEDAIARDVHENTARAVATKRRSRARHDRISREIEEAITQLGEQATPDLIMHKLQSYAGQQGSCITDTGLDCVIWRTASGKPSKLEREALGKRLARRSRPVDKAS